MTITEHTVKDFGEWYLNLAKKVREDAEGNGVHDGGASRMEAMWECYKAGFLKKEPPLKEFKEFIDQNDPDYDTYLKLKKKFEE